MSSALGKQFGLTEESTLEEIVTAVGNVIDYSETIQTATTDTSDQTKSCYRINGNYIDVVPARGLWNNWDYNSSCIKVSISSITNIRNFYSVSADKYIYGSLTFQESYPVIIVCIRANKSLSCNMVCNGSTKSPTISRSSNNWSCYIYTEITSGSALTCSGTGVSSTFTTIINVIY